LAFFASWTVPKLLREREAGQPKTRASLICAFDKSANGMVTGDWPLRGFRLPLTERICSFSIDFSVEGPDRNQDHCGEIRFSMDEQRVKPPLNTGS